MTTTRLVLTLIAVGLGVTGCAENRGYEKAFADKQAVPGSSHRFEASPDRIFQAVKVTLVQQGFIVEQADAASGLVKAARTLADPKNKKISYNISSTVDISGTPAGRSAVVTMAANQQTVTHDSGHNWMPILGPIMIPTGKTYQTTVTGEGTITDRAFYTDFFAAVDKNLSEAAADSVPAGPAPARSTEPPHRPTAQAAPNVTVAAANPPVATASAATDDAATGPPPPVRPGTDSATATSAATANAATSAPAAQPAPPPEGHQ